MVEQDARKLQRQKREEQEKKPGQERGIKSEEKEERVSLLNNLYSFLATLCSTLMQNYPLL